MIQINGNYTFTIHYHNASDRFIRRKNIVTLLGESFFLNRWCNDEFGTMNRVALGTGTRKAQKQDSGLGAETIRKTITPRVDLTSKTVKFNITFEADEIKDTTEIGVFSDDIMLSHDVYTAINTENDLLSNDTSSVDLTYEFGLETGTYRGDWTKYDENDETNYVYYTTEPNTVISVLEESTGSGYVRKNSITEVQDTPASYYQKENTKTLYIHTANSNSPDSRDIIVKT